MLKRDMVDPSGEDFGAICICAVRYAIGRRSYMPGLVQDFIRPQLRFLRDNDLQVMARDIEDADKWENGLGDPKIDRPGWIHFLYDIKRMQTIREAKKDG